MHANARECSATPHGWTAVDLQRAHPTCAPLTPDPATSSGPCDAQTPDPWTRVITLALSVSASSLPPSAPNPAPPRLLRATSDQTTPRHGAYSLLRKVFHRLQMAEAERPGSSWSLIAAHPSPLAFAARMVASSVSEKGPWLRPGRS